MNFLIKTRILILIFFSFLISCQPVELIQDVVFDNKILNKFNIVAEEKVINNFYEVKYEEKYIDSSLPNPPQIRLYNWLDENFIIFGSENKLIINIFGCINY